MGIFCMKEVYPTTRTNSLLSCFFYVYSNCKYVDFSSFDRNMGLPAKLTDEEQKLLEKYALLKKMVVSINLSCFVNYFNQ